MSGFPILDDNEFSPAHSGRHLFSSSAQNLSPTLDITPPKPTATDSAKVASSGDSYRFNDRNANIESDSELKPESRSRKNSRKLRRSIVLFTLIVLFILFGPLLPGPVGKLAQYSRSWFMGQVRGLYGSTSTSTKVSDFATGTIQPSDSTHNFSLQDFMSNLNPGECYNLGAVPKYSSAGVPVGFYYTKGAVIDCESKSAQYRFTARQAVTSHSRVKPFDATGFHTFAGEEFVYEVLPRDGRFIISSFHSGTDYKFWAVYLDPAFTLPPFIKQGGVLQIYTEAPDCDAIGGSEQQFGNSDFLTCWIVIEHR